MTKQPTLYHVYIAKNVATASPLLNQYERIAQAEGDLTLEQAQRVGVEEVNRWLATHGVVRREGDVAKDGYVRYRKHWYLRSMANAMYWTVVDIRPVQS